MQSNLMAARQRKSLYFPGPFSSFFKLSLLLLLNNNYCYIYCDINTQDTTKEIKCCQPVMTNEGPALDSRALAQDLNKVRLSLP